MCSSAPVIETEVFVMADGTETLFRCRICGAAFVPKSTPTPFTTCGKPECRQVVRGVLTCEACGKDVQRVAPGQRTCGAQKCRDAVKILTVEGRIRNRLRCQQWAVTHRNVKTSNPWLLGQPIYSPHLPGGGMAIQVTPPLHWPMELRNVRGLHGMMTALIGEDHSRFPAFSFSPWSSHFGWAVYMWNGDHAKRFAGHEIPARIFDQNVTVKFGPLIRVKTPQIKHRGHRRLTIDAVTPVCCQSTGRTAPHVVPTTETLTVALSNLAERLSLQAFSNGHIKVKVVSHQAVADSVFMGDKYGVAKGWTGQVIVDANAVAHWLFKAGEICGFGGRTAFGFGRIRVEAP